MSPVATTRHRLEAGIVSVVAAMSRPVPERLSQGVGALVGAFAGSMLRIRRRTVDQNLRLAFPDWSQRRRDAIARAAYRHLGREAMSLLRLGTLGPDEVRERTEIIGGVALREAVEEGRGVILLAGHLGNWEIAGAALAARGVPLDAVVRRQSNPLSDRRIREMREHFGMRVLYRHNATRPVLKGLREGRAVVLVADQNTGGKGSGVFVDFFGVPASAARGPGVLSFRTGASVLFMSIFRLPGTPARYRLELKALEVSRDQGPDAYAREVVQLFHHCLETEVRKQPEQYFWFHRRWRTRPGNETAPTAVSGP